MKLLAFAATNSSQSINKALVTYAAQLIDVDVEVLDLNDYEMPIYSSDRENESGIPQLAKDLFEKIGNADALAISFAEHNGSYTAAFKNVFDWISRFERSLYQNKPMVLLAASPEPGGAKNVLAAAVASTPHFAGEVKASLSIANFYDNFDMENGELTDLAIKQELQKVMKSLKAE
ncbi:NAD(P)H-dependent oxidoreductase [Paraglaciecola aquimarina]|uniref:NAD(P)H-dependent oxidoreductase n=1 Tax=Paraglaciecola aquimarina TaxID=1235557 RepID=A0ABU3SZ10_9ALTE|nr:NAD(P)H-dependent oxidoreductase [Paraglaciecola aquimarina]MDU0355255.1 NAD(P)H-dependent oxidoreductase [Paraglaciecola aquimarina]